MDTPQDAKNSTVRLHRASETIAHLAVVAVVCMVVLSPVIASSTVSGSASDQDLTTYDETDPNDSLTVTSNKIDANNVSEDSGAEVTTDDTYAGTGEGVINYTFNFTYSDVETGAEVDGYDGLFTGFENTSTGTKIGIKLRRVTANDNWIAEAFNESTDPGFHEIQFRKSYYAHIHLVDSTSTVEYELYNDSSHTDLVASTTLEYNTNDNLSQTSALRVIDNSDDNFQTSGVFSDYEVYGEGSDPGEKLDGYVTDQEGDAIESATVEAVNTSSGNVAETATTNGSGYYAMNLDDGEYNVTASKDEYVNDTETVNISGTTVTQNFTLTEQDRSLQIDTRMFLKHGESAPYTIIHGFVNKDGNFVRENVTANATVTSNNTNVVTVDTSTFELNATDDVTVNNRTFVTANYTRDDGTLLQDTKNVTVANKTVENLDILPPVTRFGASIADRTVQVIILATAVGVAAAIFAGVFAGVAGLTMAMLMGWVIGYVGDGMIIITLITAMFIGMNVAGNVDYTVRR